MLIHRTLALTLFQRLILLNAIEAQIANVKRRRSGYRVDAQIAALNDVKSQLLPSKGRRAPDLAPRIADMEAVL